MTRLAKYDKHHRSQDEKILQYYRHDYIYKRNIKTRVAVFCGLGIVVAIYILLGVIEGNIDLADLSTGAFSFGGFIAKNLIFGAIITGLYTMVSTIQGTKEYQEAQGRMFHYLKTMELLEERRRLHDISLDEWDDRETAHTRVIKREVTYD